MERIFIFGSKFSKGGTGRYSRLLSSLLSSQYSIEFVWFSRSSIQECSEIIPGLSRFPTVLKMIVASVAGIPAYFVKLLRNKPLFSISLGPLDAIPNILGCLFTSTKPIVTVHGEWGYVPWYPKMFSFSSIIALKLCKILDVNSIVAVSQGVKNNLVEKHALSPQNISVIYNPLDLKVIESKYAETVSEPFFQTDVPIIICVGNVIPVKGHYHLLRVFERLRECINCRLVICGRTDLEFYSYIKRLHVSMNYKSDVLFTGHVDNPYKYMKKSSVFVLSSISEGLPYVLLEALACGCPIVASNCSGGICEILNDGECGLISESLDGVHYDISTPLTDAEKDMLSKISRLLQSRDLQETLSRKGIERAKSFDESQIMMQYLDYFSGLIGK